MNSNSCSAEYSWLATKWEILRGSWPGSIYWLSEGIGEVALDRENIAAITRQKEVYLYFGGGFALGRPLPARSDTNSYEVSFARAVRQSSDKQSSEKEI